jgi:hypothetical protein
MQATVLALTVWLSLFAPLFCQFHGLLMGMHSEMANIAGRDAALQGTDDVLCGGSSRVMASDMAHMTQPSPDSADDLPAWAVHQTMPSSTLMESLYLLALPTRPAFQPSATAMRLQLLPALPATEPDLPRPKRPPRL